MLEQVFDAIIIGGGPAGATAGRLLAEWGYRVVIVHRESRRPSLAETIPPSAKRLFRLIGIDAHIEGAGFYRTTGNTSWWGSPEPRTEHYSEPGYQVIRSEFDSVLLNLARDAGVEVREGSERLKGGFELDASGRTGVIGTQYRVSEPRYRTVAISGVWNHSDRIAGPSADPSNTLVESYEDGWAWSVPVSPKRSFVTTMINTLETRTVRGGGLPATYAAELAKTRVFRNRLAGSRLEGQAWACDASLYHSTSYCGPRHLLLGDAGSFVDPLSSFGVKKAISSAWLGAVVVNTCLRRPEMAAVALDYFNQRERQVYADHLRQTAALFREVARTNAHPFWTARSEAPEEAGFYNEADLAQALEALKRSPSVHLHRTGSVRAIKSPCVRDREVVLEETLAFDGLPRGVEYIRGVSLPKLIEISEGATQIPALFETYNRICAPVTLPNFLSALSLLLAKKILAL